MPKDTSPKAPKEPKKKARTLVLLDSHAIIHRAYHALPDFMSSKGEPTGALYGLSTMLMKIVSDLKPDYIVACYDLPQKTFRHEAYDAYKAGRVKADEALISQIKKSRQIFEGFNVPIYDAPGFEADDVLGTIVEKLKKDCDLGDMRIIIASGDMDTMQLIDGKKVQVYTLKKGITDTILYDEEAILERFGFNPKLLPDYKGLRGDPSDNIIGIKGIGEKTATTLICTFGTIEDIYKKIKKDDEPFKKAGITPRIIELIKNNEEEALFSKTLATIRRDAPVDFAIPEKTFWESADLKKIETMFAAFEFRSLYTRLRNFFDNSKDEVASPAEFSQVLGSPLPAKAGSARPFENSLETLPEVEPARLKETSIALWLLNSDISTPDLKDMLMFANTDSFDTAYEKIFTELKEKKLDKVYAEIEAPIISIVDKMEKYGIAIDKKYFKELSVEYHTELDKLTKNIYALASVEFNINSPKQLGEVLFEKLKLEVPGKKLKKSASGGFSTKISVLEELEEGNPIIAEIMKYRELQKLLSTYIDCIPDMAGDDGRLHSRFLQNATTTGRFSSVDPNLQNLPIKSELGRRIRQGFVAGTGYKLSAFDYSQIELRVGAMLSGDKNMIQIFRDKEDVHTGVASLVFGVPLDKVDREMRRKAKVINFGIIYGMGVTALKKNLGSSREEAQTFYNNYFEQFSGIKDYLDQVKIFASKNGYTETLFGRRRYFPNINSHIPFLKSMAERTATNAPLQGTAADLIKLAIRYAAEDLDQAGLLEKAHLVLQIHDELVYEIEDGVLPEAQRIIKNAMESVLLRSYLGYKTDVPLEVHFGAGDHFDDVK